MCIFLLNHTVEYIFTSVIHNIRVVQFVTTIIKTKDNELNVSSNSSYEYEQSTVHHQYVLYIFFYLFTIHA